MRSVSSKEKAGGRTKSEAGKVFFNVSDFSGSEGQVDSQLCREGSRVQCVILREKGGGKRRVEAGETFQSCELIARV